MGDKKVFNLYGNAGTTTGYGGSFNSVMADLLNRTNPEYTLAEGFGSPMSGGFGTYGLLTDTSTGEVFPLDKTAFGQIDGTLDGTNFSLARLGDTGFNLGNWGMNGYGGLALGLGQLGIGLMSMLDRRGITKKQKKLLDQQIANNKYEMNRYKNFQKNVGRGFSLAANNIRIPPKV